MTGSITMDVINRALIAYGVEPVTDLADGSAAGATLFCQAGGGGVREFI